MLHLAAVVRGVIVGAGCLAAMVAFHPAARADPVGTTLDYNRDIRPILSNNCFQCHGPDDKERQADLRLDVVAGLTHPAASGRAAVVAGNPDESELVRRVYADDESERMPPADSNKRLRDDQKAMLKDWIAGGATIQPHWSLVVPQLPRLPEVSNQSWVRNPIDRFVLTRLEQEGLSPSPPTDRLTLVRRVYLDLIGLLPTPEQADAFVQDERPDAYEVLVEGLLASPHYGERWARAWLDLARYSDTNGYEKDRPRSIWPYRDWVIRAINADMPFDRFTIEQIAGDMLDGADLDSRVATGFHRNTMVNEEGGIDVEEFRFYSVVDRVNTTAAVWLGLTVGCAQCHNHKFDPITQREYYQLFAMLNNADEPEIAVPEVSIAKQRVAIEEKIAQVERSRRDQLNLPACEAWATETAKTARHWEYSAPNSAISTGKATMAVLPDHSVLVSGDKPNQDTYVVEIPSPEGRISAIRLEVLPDSSLPEGGPGRAPLFSDGDFMLGEFSLAIVDSTTGQPRPISLTNASHSYASDNASAATAIDGDLDTGWSIKGRTGQAHQAVFPFAEPLNVGAGGMLRVTLEQRYIHQMTIGRFRLSLTTSESPQAASVPTDIESILVLEPSQRSDGQTRQLRGYYLTIAPELAELNKEIALLRSSLPKYPTTLVVEERQSKHARTTRLAHRGEYLSPRDPLDPGVPEVLHALPAGGARNRLALARWLVDPRNPLVGRVVMNRHWQAFFGRGLVRTSEDFGLRGEAPSHPELLDYLATEFVASGWSVKQMHRRMVTSATYRQQSNTSVAGHQRDPQNILLSRGPRLRVEAETVRDIALCAAGELSEDIGGPSVFPPQPAGATDLAYSKGGWAPSQGAARFRRGLYTYSKRTSPYAAFTTFDAPSGETCTARRDRSNTPLQALTLLNDTVFVEAAQAVARRAMQSPDTNDHERARFMFRLCLTRAPTAEEVSDLLSFLDIQRARIKQNELDAITIVPGASDSVEHTELAAWTLLARAILNLDEFITKQ